MTCDQARYHIRLTEHFTHVYLFRFNQSIDRQELNALIFSHFAHSSPTLSMFLLDITCFITFSFFFFFFLSFKTRCSFSCPTTTSLHRIIPLPYTYKLKLEIRVTTRPSERDQRNVTSISFISFFCLIFSLF